MANATLVLGADIKRAIAELQRLTGFVHNWSNQMMGMMMSAFSFYAVAQGVRTVVQSMNEFNVEMSKLKALTGETGANLNALRQNALNLAGAYRAITVAQAQVQLSKAGFSAKEIMDSTEAVILLATAAGVDLPKATDIAAATLRGFGLASEEMGRVTDVMAKILNETQADLSDFGEAMKYVAPNAAAANISLEETAAMLGTLSNAGIRGSMAGTALRRVVQDLAGESGTLTEKFQKLNEKNITASYAFDEVGRIASTAFLILARGADTTDRLITSTKNATGSTKEMSKIMTDNVTGDWNKLIAALELYIQKANNALQLTRSFLQMLTDMFRVSSLSGDDRKKMGISWLDSDQEIIKKMDAYALVVKGKGNEIGATFINAVKAGGDKGGVKPWWVDYLNPTKKEVPKKTASFELPLGEIEKLENKIKDFEARRRAAFGPNAATEIADFTSKIEKLREVLKKLTEVQKDVADRAQIGPMGKLSIKARSLAPEISDIIANAFGKRNPLAGGLGSLGPGVGEELDAADERGNMIGRVLMQGFKMAIRGIGRSLAEAFSGGNWQSGLLDMLGNIAIEVGGAILAIGLGVEALKDTLNNPFGGGIAAIAAGVALIGVGAGLKAWGASFQPKPDSGGGQGSMPRFADRDGSFNGEWRIRGVDLVYVLDKQGYRSSVV